MMKYHCFIFSSFLFIIDSSWLVVVQGFTTTTMTTPTRHVVVSNKCKTSTTKLFLENWVANLIDEEYYRLHHKDEFETEWMKKNKQAVIQSLHVHGNNNNLLVLNEDASKNVDHVQLIRDKRLAERDPQRYCADRCIATGNCDVYEDIFDFTPEEVMAFCNDCVLEFDEDKECVIPESFYAMDLLKP